MSQLNNENNFNNQNQNGTENVSDENQKNVSDNKQKKNKKKHPTRNMIIFLILFTSICVGGTLFLIWKDDGNKKLEQVPIIGDVLVQETNTKSQVVSDGLGLHSLKETYKGNALKVERIEFKDGKKLDDSYIQDYQLVGNYIQVSGLKNTEIQDSINKKLKEEAMNLYGTNDLNKYDWIEIRSDCTANFANVLSVHVYKYGNSTNDWVGIHRGLNFDLSTGEEIKFEDIFTSDAAIKNILSKSAYDTFTARVTGGTMNPDELDFSGYDSTDELGLSEKELQELKMEREEKYSEVENKVFRLMAYYNNGGNLIFSFSPRTIKIYYNNDEITIPMKQYYNQIAIYNRFKNNSNLYDNTYEDVIPNDAIPVFVSTNNYGVSADVHTSMDVVFVEYFNLKKVSNNLLVHIFNVTGTPNEFTRVLENSVEMRNKINEIINEASRKNDGKARYVQIQIYAYDNYSVSVEEMCVDSKYGDEFFEVLINGFRNGWYSWYAPGVDEFKNEESLRYSSWKNNVEVGKNIVASSYNFNYDDNNKTWEKKTYIENGVEVTDNEGQNDEEENDKEESEMIDETKQELNQEQVDESEISNEKGKEGTTEQENDRADESKNTSKTENESNSNKTSSKNVIVIDPGHQAKGNNNQEPIGPGATQTKAKVTGGAIGVATGQTEYELALKVSKQLQQKLEAKGYTVIMTRTTNNVDISNKERAEIANNANAAAFVRIHANSSTSSSAKGVLTMCQTANNPYNGNLADESYRLSKAILDNIVKATGAQNRGVTRTDDMSGINWCTVPSTIVEMGFLSNSEEDKLLADEAYQEKIVDGIVAGLEMYPK